MDKKSLKKSLANLEQLRKEGELDDAIEKAIEIAQERGGPVPAAPLRPEKIKALIETMKDADAVPEAVQRIIQAQKEA